MRGVYINLDRTPDRRREIETELVKLRSLADYRRFSAIDGRETQFRPEIVMRGALGCYMSHLQVLREYAGSDDWLHVIEDDALVSRYAETAIRYVVTDPAYERFDLVFTNARIIAYPGHMVTLADMFDRSVETDAAGNVTSLKIINAISLSDYQFFYTTSYLVNPRSITKVADAIEPSIMHKPLKQVDGVYSDLSRSGVLSIGCLLPFVTIPRPDVSTTIQVSSLPWEAPLDVMDGALYVDRDVASLRERLRRLAVPPPHRSATHDIIGDTYRAILTGRLA
jgi:GR25 family glycosyltransferase involved in LPS biosynthesis